MSKIEKIAQALGLDLEEKFEMEGHGGVYKFTNCLVMRDDNDSEWVPSTLFVNELLETKIKKLPWEPEIGQCYYAPNIVTSEVFGVKHDNNPVDKHIIKLGLARKTEKAAYELLCKLQKFCIENFRSD